MYYWKKLNGKFKSEAESCSPSDIDFADIYELCQRTRDTLNLKYDYYIVSIGIGRLVGVNKEDPKDSILIKRFYDMSKGWEILQLLHFKQSEDYNLVISDTVYYSEEKGNPKRKAHTKPSSLSEAWGPK